MCSQVENHLHITLSTPTEFLISLAHVHENGDQALKILIPDEGCHLSQVSLVRKRKSVQITASIQPSYFTNENS